MKFYTIFSPPERECWKIMKEKGGKLVKKLSDIDLVAYITTLS